MPETTDKVLASQVHGKVKYSPGVYSEQTIT
jgi:hypothetical protein